MARQFVRKFWFLDVDKQPRILVLTNTPFLLFGNDLWLNSWRSTWKAVAFGIEGKRALKAVELQRQGCFGDIWSHAAQMKSWQVNLRQNRLWASLRTSIAFLPSANNVPGSTAGFVTGRTKLAVAAVDCGVIEFTAVTTTVQVPGTYRHAAPEDPTCFLAVPSPKSGGRKTVISVASRLP